MVALVSDNASTGHRIVVQAGNHQPAVPTVHRARISQHIGLRIPLTEAKQTIGSFPHGTCYSTMLVSRVPVSATLIIPKLTRYSAAGSPNTLGGSWCGVFPRVSHTAPFTVQHVCLPAQQAGVLQPSQQLKYFTQRCRKTAGIRSHCTRFGS